MGGTVPLWLIQQKYWKLFWVMFLTRIGHNLKTDEHSFFNTPGSEFWILRNTFPLFRNHSDSFKISKRSYKEFLESSVRTRAIIFM